MTAPQVMARSSDIAGADDFPNGCSLSPDGLCVLTATARRLHLYNTPPLPPVTTSTEREEQEGQLSTEQPADGSNGASSSSSQGTVPPTTPASWKAALSYQAGDTIRSYSWYPHMNSSDPTTCAFLCASRDQPIHLIDAYTSAIRATYRPYNGMDEMESPTVVEFSPDGGRIFAAGFRTDRTLHVFRTDLPGRESDVLRLGKTRRSRDGQKGMISSVAFPRYHTNDVAGAGSQSVMGNPLHNPAIFAVGCYSPGSIYIYDDRMPSEDNPAGTVLHGGICVVGHGKAFSRRKRRFASIGKDGAGIDNDGGAATGTNAEQEGEEEEEEEEEDIFSAAKVKWYQSRARGGITQLTWSPAGDHILYSASRRSDAVLAWDLRMLSGDASRPIRGMAAYARDGDTNQRLEFCFDDYGKHMFVASRDRCVKIYDVASAKLVDEINTGDVDVSVNGVSYKSTNAWGRKGGLLSVALGARQFPSFDCTDGDQASDDDNAEEKKNDGESTGTYRAAKVKSRAPTDTCASGELRVYHVSQ